MPGILRRPYGSRSGKLRGAVLIPILALSGVRNVLGRSGQIANAHSIAGNMRGRGERKRQFSFNRLAK